MTAIKHNILGRMDSAPHPVRICCIKFVQKVVHTQTPGPIADPRVCLAVSVFCGSKSSILTSFVCPAAGEKRNIHRYRPPNPRYTRDTQFGSRGIGAIRSTLDSAPRELRVSGLLV